MLLFLTGIGFQELIILLFILIIPFIIWLWAFIDVLKSDFKDSTMKLIWVLVIFFLPVLGCLLYFIIGRAQRIKTN